MSTIEGCASRWTGGYRSFITAVRVCRLRHEELLDAAHIIPDAEAAADPHARNGISLCTLHHAAFDRYFIGIRPDRTIEIREDLRVERDGPTLAHAIQALHGNSIILPKRAGTCLLDPERRRGGAGYIRR